MVYRPSRAAPASKRSPNLQRQISFVRLKHTEGPMLAILLGGGDAFMSPSRASSNRSRAARIRRPHDVGQPDSCVLLTVVVPPQRRVDDVECSLKIELPIAQARFWNFEPEPR